MPWQWRKRSSPAPDSTSNDTDPATAAPEETTLPPPPISRPSPGLAGLVEHVASRDRPQLLDLGPPVAANIPFFAEFGGRHHVADLHASLQDDDEVAVRFHDQPVPVLEELLPAVEGGFDAVLAWDLFNYLTREPWAALAEVLAERCAPDALVFALVATGAEIPAHPHRFAIEAPDRLSYRVDQPRPRKCPRWAPAEVGRQMPQFRVERSYLLRHGIQEYLLARR